MCPCFQVWQPVLAEPAIDEASAVAYVVLTVAMHVGFVAYAVLKRRQREAEVKRQYSAAEANNEDFRRRVLLPAVSLATTSSELPLAPSGPFSTDSGSLKRSTMDSLSSSKAGASIRASPHLYPKAHSGGDDNADPFSLF